MNVQPKICCSVASVAEHWLNVDTQIACVVVIGPLRSHGEWEEDTSCAVAKRDNIRSMEGRSPLRARFSCRSCLRINTTYPTFLESTIYHVSTSTVTGRIIPAVRLMCNLGRFQTWINQQVVYDLTLHAKTKSQLYNVTWTHKFTCINTTCTCTWAYN